MRAALAVFAFLCFPGIAAAQGADWDALGGPGKSAKAGSDDIFSEMSGQVSLRFFDALTGKPLVGAAVRFQGETVRTDAEGKAVFATPSDLREDEDVRYAYFQRRGYITSKIELRFMLRSLWFNRYSISPVLPPGKLRIVLDWAKKPMDLDAHLIKRGGYHISYQDMRKWEDRAQLDRDDRDGHGPETITINKLDHSAAYDFMVHDYTHRKDADFSKFQSSRGRVSVFGDGKLLHQFVVPAGSGLAWRVFEIQRGQLRVINSIEADVPRSARRRTRR